MRKTIRRPGSADQKAAKKEMKKKEKFIDAGAVAEAKNLAELRDIVADLAGDVALMARAMGLSRGE